MRNASDVRKNQERKALVEDWESSGESLSRWCRNKNIPRSTFTLWEKKFLKKNTPSQSPFIELPPEEKTNLHLECKGIKILLEKNFDEDMLIQCLKLLRRISC